MAYEVKSETEQIRDVEILNRIKWRQDIYFEQLQLRNKLVGIDTYEKVNIADRDVSSERLMMLDTTGKCDMQHFLSIHEYLFQDIYYFAGKLRDVPMEIDSVTVFTGPNQLPVKLKKFFDNLKRENNLKGLSKENFIERMAEYLTDINILHPFREGNGRTKRVFFQEVSKQAGYDLNWAKCSKEEWKYADECAFDSSRDGCRDTTYLKILLDRAVEPLVKTRNKTSEAWQEYMNTPLKEQQPNSSEQVAQKKKTNYMA